MPGERGNRSGGGRELRAGAARAARALLFNDFDGHVGRKAALKVTDEETGSRPFDVFLETLRGAEKREETLGKEFVYAPRPGDAYDLELVPFREVSLENYMTVSPAGMSHYVGGLPMSFVSLRSWLRERRLYRSLRKIPFFQEFPARKAFLHWRNAGRWGRMAKAGQVLEDRLFFLHPWFRRALSPRCMTWRASPAA